MSEAMTPAQRQKLRRERLTAEGFCQRVTWVHSADKKRYDDFMETLRKPDTHVSSGPDQQS